MPLTTTDKVKINKYIRENKIGEIYYQEMCDVIGKRGKITDLEFIEYFTDSVLHEFRKNVKISIKHVTKLVQTVDTFLDWMIEEEDEITLEVLDKIKSFDEFYQEYLTRMDSEIDDELSTKYIKPLVEKAKEQLAYYSSHVSVTKYLNQISEMENEIKNLKKELVSVQSQLDKTKKIAEQKQTKIETLGNSLTQVTNDSNNKSHEIDSLNLIIKELNSKIELLEEELKLKIKELEEKEDLLIRNLEFKESLVEEIARLNSEVEAFTSEVKELQKKIKEEEKQKKQTEKLIIKENRLMGLIYDTLLFNNRSISELVEIADKEGITTTTHQILELLNRMKSEINITTGPFSLNPTYMITTPHLNQNGEFNISLPYDTKYYDIMLVSDFHVTEFDEKTITAMDRLTDYCVKNGINLILNLGDFFEGIGGKTLEYGHAVKNYRLIEDAIKCMPKADNLYHGILGGNHDRNIASYGFDPIKLLTSGREDLIDLGYKYSNVSIRNPERVLGEFGIHHPDVFDFSIDLDDDGIETESIRQYLKETYNKNNRNLDDSYIDIFGHTHKSQFNYASAYCYIPPFLKSYSRKGAMHLRIYFDVDNKIKSMVFMPLDYSGNLSKNNEIIYQKKLTK